MQGWEFWIDVGGTFTDVLARTPDDRLVTFKTLSSGVFKGRVDSVLGTDRVVDPSRCADPDGFWIGYSVRFVDEAGQAIATGRVTGFQAGPGILRIEPQLAPTIAAGTRYELFSHEGAPLLAIRYLLGLRLDQEIPQVSVRLGTTRGTNALLTRRGARTAFVTTRGFADVLLIGNQNRPRLFDLAIEKPEPIFESVVEIDERMTAEGAVLREPEPEAVRRQLAELKQTGVESVAICLLHSFANGAHEEVVEQLAREVGFTEVSRSSRLSPLIKIVSRGDTTVMDAYLNPILREYVASLRAPLGQAELRLMTSSGGLVDAERFVGKDSILSGPAGGVIGFSRVAERAGFEKSIGFDMGGTSTDVSRYDGTYELEFETQKAGVRVVAPMLAIETVAAGGGSVCDFDGVKLTVGPQSAGADPGPACYGRGGPLAITDINLYLGRLPESHFPFPLARDAVEQRLQGLCDRIADSPMGRRYAPVELAEGFRKIANANMVRPIRTISVARGYDPADYTLVTFGGAGGQHACAIARALGMKRVLSHPYAGILSAYGIGLADVRRFRERAVLKAFNQQLQPELEAMFAELEAAARAEVLAEGIAADRVRPANRSLDMRYRGAESTINVVRPNDGDYVRRFTELHHQLYGYVHFDRTTEVTAARVEVVGTTPDPPDDAAPVVPRRSEPAETVKAWFDGKQLDTGIYLRGDLRPGDAFEGPAILCEPTSTIVVEPGFRAEVLARGEILLTDQGAAQAEWVSTQADPVMLEIFNNLFASIAEQMGVTLQRTSFSTNVKERLDFSCAIFSPGGDLVVNAPHIPVHLGAMSETVKRIIADNPAIAPGDVFVTNDPYRGGSHLPDVTVVTPVHHGDSGELLFFTASRAHHAEIGGIVPGSMPPFSKNLGEEGVLLRNFKLIEGGRSREAELRELLASGSFPSRSIGDNLADVSAQVAANNSGAGQLLELVARYSLPVVQAYMQHIQRAAAEKMRMALARIPAGRYSHTDHLDDGSPIVATIEISHEQTDRNAEPARSLTIDGLEHALLAAAQMHLGADRQITVAINSTTGQVAIQCDGHDVSTAVLKEILAATDVRAIKHVLLERLREDTAAALGGDAESSPTARLIPATAQASTVSESGAGSRAVVDFTGTGPVLSTNLNANRAIVTAAVLYVFRCLIDEDIPLNSGVLDPVEIVLPECLLNPPEHDDPAQCAAMVGGNVETSQRVVDTLLGALQVAAASQGTMNNLTFGDETFGYYETICGGSGATPEADGADAVHTHMTNTRLTDAEIIERRYPVRIHEFSIRRGSGGAGRHRGGDGIVRRIEFLKPLKVSILSERRGPYAPFGLQGGEPGALGRNALQRAGAEQGESLGGKVHVEVQPGDVLTIETPGGGGFGA